MIIGATLAGIGGAYLALSSHAFQAENITAGRGFIAVAMVYFGKWRPARAFFGTFLFGAAYLLGAFFQVVGSIIPYYFLLMVPYILTLVVLVGIARGARPPFCARRTLQPGKRLVEPTPDNETEGQHRSA